MIKLQKELKELKVDGDLVKYKEDNFNLELSFNDELMLSELTRVVGDLGIIMMVFTNVDKSLKNMLDIKPGNLPSFSFMMPDLYEMGIIKKEE